MAKTPEKKPAQQPATPAAQDKALQIKAPNLQILEFRLVGDAPLVTNRFANKAKIMATQAAGSKGKTKGKVREGKDFDACYEAAKHVATEGWCGVHAGSFRNGLISACKIVGFKMTHAKLALFVLADGYDRDGVPLVRIHGGQPERHDAPVRNASGVIDIRSRPMWKSWWLNLRVRYDADMFSAEDVANLLMRVGMQVGIGEGRPDSKDSPGVGWGTFVIGEADHERQAAE